MRGMDHAESAQKLIDAYRIHYNFIREHSSIKKTPAIVVDDVITTGESMTKAIKTIRDEGEEVNYMITIVFRGTDEEHRRIETENKIKYYYIFKGSEFTDKYEKEHPEVLKH